MTAPGLTPRCTSEGAAASTRISGSQPPTARQSVRSRFILASALSAAAAESATSSSPTTDFPCQRAKDGSRQQNSASDTAIGATASATIAGTSAARPMTALTTVKVKVRPTASRPAKVSLTISA